MKFRKKNLSFSPQFKALTGVYILTLFASILPSLLYSQIPTASIHLPNSSMLGEDFTFTIEFDNTDTSLIGYDPIIELIVPILPDDGEEGAFPDSVTQIFSIENAEYLGNQVITEFVGYFDEISGEIINPVTEETVSGNPGDALYLLHYPLSSIAPDQPAPIIEITSELHALTPISAQTISARGIFNFGNDPTGQSSPINGATTTDTLTPTILDIRKELSYAEHETATGPTFPGKWSLIGNIAEAATIEQVQFSDALPEGFYVTSMTVVRPAGGTVQQGGTNPGQTLTVDWESISGSTVNANSEIVVEISGYVPEVNAASSLILPPTVGESVSLNQFTADYEFERIGIEPEGGLSVSIDSNVVQLENLTLATQKRVSSVNDILPIGYSPSDTISYLVNIQVSDYKEVRNLIIEEDILTAAGLLSKADILGDALTFDSQYTPVYEVSMDGVTVSGTFDTQNYTVSENPPDHETGTSRITFDLSQQLIDDNRYDSTGTLIGAGILSSSSSTTASIRYRATIDDSFDSPPSGDSSVDILDVLTNSVDIVAFDQIDNILVGDESSASIQIQGAALSHTIERILTVEGETIDSPSTRHPISPGDTVTFSIFFSVPTGDLEDLVLNQFIPYSLFSINDVNGDGLSGDLPYFTPTIKAYPAVGEVSYGPSDEYFANYTTYGPPGLSSSVTNNSFSLSYGDIDSPSGDDSDGDQVYNFEIRATFVAGVDNLPDDFTLTSLAQLLHESTNAGGADTRAFAGLNYSRSVPVITKGVVQISGSGSQISPSPTAHFDNAGSDGNGTDAQPGDLVTFAITIQNTGSDPISVMTLGDSLPSQLDSTAARILSINRADGLPIATIPAVDAVVNSSDESALFGGTLHLDTTISGNYLTAGDTEGAPYGSETLIITLEAPILPSVAANELILNNANAEIYYATGIPADGPYETISDSATVRTESIGLNKSLVTGLFGDEPSTGTILIDDQTVQTATIGEILTYDLEISIPQGQSENVILSDLLPDGLAFIPVNGIQASVLSMHSDIVSSNLSVGDTDQSSSSIEITGNLLTLDLGNLNHTVDGDSTLRSLTVRLYCVVADVPTNVAELRLTNSATLTWDGGSANASSSFVIARPNVQVTTAISPLNTGDIQAGTTMRVDVTVTNSGVNSALSTAYDFLLQSTVESIYFNVSTVSELETPDGFTFSTTGSGSDLIVDYGSFDLLPEDSYTFSYTVDVKDDISLPTTLQVPSNGSGTSLPLDPPSGTESTETDDDIAEISTSFPSVSKARVSTSESHTDNEFVTIGERTVYRISVSMPNGVIEDLKVIDLVPNGLDFVGNNTDANLSFPGKGYELSGPMATLMSSNLTSVTDPDPTPDDSQTSDGNGDNITFQFATVTNTPDGDDSNDFFNIDIELVAMDVSVNVGHSGTNKRLRNRARVQSTGMTADQGNSGFVSTYVVEPFLDFEKTFTPSSGDAGDTVSVELKVTNSGDSPAFDVTLEDTIDGLLFQTDLIDVSGNAPAGWQMTSNDPGHGDADVTISIQSDSGLSLAPGASATFTFDVTTDNDINVPQTITNTAEITSFSTLDASLTHPSGISERTVTGVEASDTLEMTGYSIDLTLISTSEGHTSDLTAPPSLTIGERALLRIDVNLPEGNSTAQYVYLQLPAGIDFVGSNPDSSLAYPGFGYGGFGGPFGPEAMAALVQTIDPDPTADDSTTTDGGAGQIAFEFSSVLNLPDDEDNDGFYFYVEVVAVDDNSIIGFGENQSTASISALIEEASSSVSVQFVEPALELTKTMAPLSSSSPDQTTIQLQVTNTGLSTAFDLTLEDILDASAFDLSTLSITSTPSGFDNSTDGNTVSFTSNGGSIAPGASLSFEFSCNLLPSASSPVANTANVSTSSTLDDSTTRPSGIGERELPQISANAELPIPNILLIKKVTDLNYTGAPLDAGDEIGYTLTVTNTGGQAASSVTLLDTIPEHTSYVNGSLTIDGISHTPSLPEIDIDLSTVSPGQSKVIYFEVTVDLELDPAAREISNSARATYTERSTVVVSDNDPEGHDSTTDDFIDSEEDTGLGTDDDDPSVLPLLQSVVTQRSYLAFEDLKNRGWNDWDHNDVVLDITTHYVTDTNNNVEGVIVIYQMIARGAGHKHRINLRLPFIGSGSYHTSVLENDGAPVLTRTGNGLDEINTVIYEWDWDTLIPYTGGRFNWGASRTERFDPTDPGRIGIVQIDIDDPSSNPLTTFSQSPHDTWLYSHSTNVDIHRIQYAIGDTQIAYEGPLYGRSLPFVVEFPEGFNWPAESKRIWNSHPDYVDYIKSGETSPANWWQNYDTELIWVDDEGNPPALTLNNPIMSLLANYTPGTNNVPIALPSANLLLAVNDSEDNESSSASLTWSSDLETPVFASPIIRNVLGGDELEILISSLDGKVYILDHNGNPASGWPQATDPGVRVSPNAGDIDGDGLIDIVVGTPNGRLFAWNVDGTSKPGFPIELGESIHSIARMVNLDGNLGAEILVHGGASTLHILRHDGSALPGWPQYLGGEPDNFGRWLLASSPVVFDLNLDGSLQIAVGSTSNEVSIFNVDGTSVSGWPKVTGDWIYSTITPIDLDGDFEPEIVAGSGDHKLYAWKASGQLVDGFPLTLDSAIAGSVAAADIDSDGRNELAVATIGGSVYVIDPTGTILDGWPIATDAQITASPLIVDVNDDGYLDIVSASRDNWLYAWDLAGTPLAEATYKCSDWVESTPAVGDIDADGLLELVFASFDGSVNLIDLSTSATTNHGWNSFTGDRRSVLDSDDTDMDSDGLPDGFELVQFRTLGTHSIDDSDGDGMSNINEWEAGTDPNSTNDSFTLRFEKASNQSPVRLCWSGRAGRTYEVILSADLSLPIEQWSLADGNSVQVCSDDEEMSYEPSNVGGNPAVFYRVIVYRTE